MIIRSHILIFLFFSIAHFTWGQLKIVPVPKAQYGETKGQNPNLKLAQLQNKKDTIDIPFWEDFSTYTGMPDTTKWLNSQGIYVNNHMGINPPSLNVATFDGADAFGGLYSQTLDQKGAADSLVSQSIDLGSIADGKKTSVYLSFFWQMQGNGEIPEEEDSLELFFKDMENNWISQWSKKTNENIQIDTFLQEIIQVGEEFLHAGFQFKFQSYGRLSGPWDSWNIDYIFLNQNRTPGDTLYVDRTLTSIPSSLFSPYTAIPSKQFQQDTYRYMDSSAVGFYNLLKDAEGYFLHGYVKDTLSNKSDFLEVNPDLKDVLLNEQKHLLLRSRPLVFENIDPNVDSLVLETVFYINFEDGYFKDVVDNITYEHIDFRVNDTSSTLFTIADYFAYDDGTAEFGVGINQEFGKMAYQFVAEEPDYLIGVDIYFPKIANSPGGASIQITVWDTLSEEDTVYLSKPTPHVVQTSTLNHFVYYQLNNPIWVEDTFYIGFTQDKDDFVGVGLDRSSDTGDKIFFNLEGVWEQNTDIKGSLMMRPKFHIGTLVGLEENPLPKTSFLYPNPAREVCYIQGDFDNIAIYDLLGKEYLVDYMQEDGKIRIDISSLKNGLYVIKTVEDRQSLAFQLLIHR